MMQGSNNLAGQYLRAVEEMAAKFRGQKNGIFLEGLAVMLMEEYNLEIANILTKNIDKAFDTFPSRRQIRVECDNIKSNMKPPPIAEEKYSWVSERIPGCTEHMEALMNLMEQGAHEVGDSHHGKFLMGCRFCNVEVKESAEIFGYWQAGEFHPAMERGFYGFRGTTESGSCEVDSGGISEKREVS